MDLQSIPFNHSGTDPFNFSIDNMEPMEGFKPPTIRLQIERSIN